MTELSDVDHYRKWNETMAGVNEEKNHNIASLDLWIDGIDMDENAGWRQSVTFDFERFKTDDGYADRVSTHIAQLLEYMAKEVEAIGTVTPRHNDRDDEPPELKVAMDMIEERLRAGALGWDQWDAWSTRMGSRLSKDPEKELDNLREQLKEKAADEA
jgi:hypothetical protein